MSGVCGLYVFPFCFGSRHVAANALAWKIGMASLPPHTLPPSRDDHRHHHYHHDNHPRSRLPDYHRQPDHNHLSNLHLFAFMTAWSQGQVCFRAVQHTLDYAVAHPHFPCTSKQARMHTRT